MLEVDGAVDAPHRPLRVGLDRYAGPSSSDGELGVVRQGAVIIAAHDEEAVIGRTLDALLATAAADGIEVVVACNGCTDDTAAVARLRSGVVVPEIEQASKPAGLRAGDRLVQPGPRIYLDADIVLTSRAASEVLAALRGQAIAARPPHTFDTTGADWVVRRWYRVRQSLPSIATALWGAGCYGLSEAGRARFAEFPDVVSDDLFIHSQFSPAEIVIVDTDPLVVTTPRRAADLVRILRRSYRTQAEVAGSDSGISTGQRDQLADLLALLRRSPSRAFDVLVYVSVVAYSRALVRFVKQPSSPWERDVSSREAR